MPTSSILNKRQELMIKFLEESKEPLAVSEFMVKVNDAFKRTARVTIIRDLQLLIAGGYVQQDGRGRGVVYQLSPRYRAIKPIDVEAYFQIDPDKREIQKNFNFAVFSLLKHIFTKDALTHLRELNQLYLKNIKKLSAAARQREFERLTVELSWKSSRIEGNTYTLLETEYLLPEQKEPKGHS